MTMISDSRKNLAIPMSFPISIDEPVRQCQLSAPFSGSRFAGIEAGGLRQAAGEAQSCLDRLAQKENRHRSK